MTDNSANKNIELVNVEVDGKQIQVPKGTNLIKAAKQVGTDVPYYCYHPHLSVPGNCRMCQVEVVGAPKLMIGCHTQVQEGMKIKTQATSQAVKDAQAATLEFILINHPLDCTVCDQAGHCKLQDYHYEYNARPSRFLEEKEHKVKAEPLGPTVMLDGERCIMCTRCIRFCDEVTKTSELGMLNRGDRSVIAVHPGKELNNPLSGTVVDLCPVGALTHKEWRFNTRIWYTKQTNSICTGCSTGCNVRVAERDGQVVQVKARQNDDVNKEWLCDEGRYGFGRFLPQERVITPIEKGKPVEWENIWQAFRKIKDAEPVVFLGPDITVEDYYVIKQYLDRSVKKYQLSVAYKERSLTDVEAILISPDYAANYKGAEFLGLVSDAGKSYQEALSKIRSGEVKSLLVIGDKAFDNRDLDVATLAAIARVPDSIGLLSDAAGSLTAALSVVAPIKTILEVSGCLINRKLRIQYSDRVINPSDSTKAIWEVINHAASLSSVNILNNITNDRELTNFVLGSESKFSGLTIKNIKAGGVDLQNWQNKKDAVSATLTA